MDLRQYITRLFRVGPRDSWSLVTAAGLASLILLWAWQLFATWGVWGNLTIDSGHEMYVPAVLAQGKTLYRDVWFMYGPASPYFNSYLFQAFGIHLNVLYWAGSLSALGAAIFLFLIGMRLSAWPVGWAAGMIQIAEAFRPSHFSFPLPYSFAAVYGCLVGCLFLWVAIIASRSSSWRWMLVAGSLAAMAFLLKPEFGMAAYGTLGLLIVVRGLHKSIKSVARDLTALLPGLAFCATVIYWMVSLRGVDFITQENIVSWPTSYFMQTYGRSWLEHHGLMLSAPAIRDAVIRALFPAGVLLEVYCLFVWSRRDTIASLLRWVVLPAALAGYVILRSPTIELVLALVFPRDMVLYVALAALLGWWNFWRQETHDRDPSVPILLSFSALVAFRILMSMGPGGYSIYYNGPVILGYLLLIRAAFRAPNETREAACFRDAFVCVLPTLLIVSAVGHFAKATDVVPLTTQRGTVRVPADLAANYHAALVFMKQQAAAGESVLSIPEDTSLYFLSETDCPIRLYLFVPGILAPGKMTDELIQEIEQKRIRYLLWSNRTFEDFGVPVFGTDFDEELGDYFRSRYRRLGPVTPAPGWRADVWERKSQVAGPTGH